MDEISNRERASQLRTLGLSVREIAESVSVPRATVGDWVKGTARGPYGRLETCAWCGEMFVARHHAAKFCCRAHTMAAAGKAYRQRKRARA